MAKRKAPESTVATPDFADPSLKAALQGIAATFGRINRDLKAERKKGTPARITTRGAKGAKPA